MVLAGSVGLFDGTMRVVSCGLVDLWSLVVSSNGHTHVTPVFLCKQSDVTRFGESLHTLLEVRYSVVCRAVELSVPFAERSYQLFKKGSVGAQRRYGRWKRGSGLLRLVSATRQQSNEEVQSQQRWRAFEKLWSQKTCCMIRSWKEDPEKHTGRTQGCHCASRLSNEVSRKAGSVEKIFELRERFWTVIAISQCKFASLGQLVFSEIIRNPETRVGWRLFTFEVLVTWRQSKLEVGALKLSALLIGVCSMHLLLQVLWTLWISIGPRCVRCRNSRWLQPPLRLWNVTRAPASSRDLVSLRSTQAPNCSLKFRRSASNKWNRTTVGFHVLWLCPAYCVRQKEIWHLER